MSDLEDRLVEWLSRASRVCAFGGAGVSAESGLPTFRGPDGLWEGHRVEDVATPAAFRRDPHLVWRFYALRQEALVNAQPNAAHRVLAEMEDRYPHFLLVTQNVDDLHERAGSRELLKLHGSLMEVRCLGCGKVQALVEPVRSSVVEGGELPVCACGGLLRPNVVWFGEPLDMRHFLEIDRFFGSRAPSRAELLLLVVGTSGMVGGGYGLTELARRAGGRVVEINPEASYLSGEADLVLREPAGELLGRVWPRVCAGG